MRHLIFVLAACVGLGACSYSQMLAERDDKECRAKGNEAGSVGYTDCRAAIEKQRQDDRENGSSIKPHFIPGTPGAPLDGGA